MFINLHKDMSLYNSKEISMTDFLITDEKLYNLTDLEIPLEVFSISLRKCFIRNIPKNFFMKFKNLETIDLYANSLESFDFNIPESVTTIDLSYNKIKSIDIEDVKNLEYVNLSFNFMEYFPLNLENIRYDINNNNIPETFINQREIKLAFGFNNENGINNRDNVNGFGIQGENGFRNPRIKNNVHETNIQESTRKSILYLMDKSFQLYPEEPNYIEEIMEYYRKKKYNFITRPIVSIFSFLEPSKILLKYYDSFENHIVYDYNNNKFVTNSQILERIWAHAKNSDKCDSIITNLFIQMKDGKNYCFVGKYTRLVNTLSSFVENVAAEIPIKTKISNKVVILKNKGLSNEELLNQMKEFMDELEISEEEQEPWLDAILEL